ncbi:MAG: hypothetical protein KA714_30810 [Limnoraphis sp. WC205]|nr:hypothetical protein [Limnoraphis sp. WC205]
MKSLLCIVFHYYFAAYITFASFEPGRAINVIMPQIENQPIVESGDYWLRGAIA